MPTIHSTLTHTYRPTPTTPIGFEATFEVYDATAGGGAGETFVTSIQINTTNASYWSLEAAVSTGKRDNAGNWIRETAQAYDAYGITATWTERISDDPSTPTRYILKGRFDSPGGMVQVLAQSTQLADPDNQTPEMSRAIPIPALP